jgi:hypothetical protein
MYNHILVAIENSDADPLNDSTHRVRHNVAVPVLMIGARPRTEKAQS